MMQGKLFLPFQKKMAQLSFLRKLINNLELKLFIVYCKEKFRQLIDSTKLASFHLHI